MQCSQEINSTRLDFALRYFHSLTALVALLIPYTTVDNQGVATYAASVEVFVTGIKNLDRWKLSLITWSLYSEALDPLILQEFKGQKRNHASLVSEKVHWSVDFSCSESSWSLDRLLKWCWSLDSLLIPVANASIGDMYETTPITYTDHGLLMHYVIICWCVKVDGDIKAAWSWRAQTIWPAVIHPLHALPSLVSRGQTKCLATRDDMVASWPHIVSVPDPLTRS